MSTTNLPRQISAVDTADASSPVQLDLLPREQSYQVYFRSELQWGRRDFDAETPEQALAFARRFAEEHWDELDLQYYDNDGPINEIEVCDSEYTLLASWRDEYLRLSLAARDLLDAVEKAVTALNTAPRFQVPALELDSYEVASICERAIRAAKDGAQ